MHRGLTFDADEQLRYPMTKKTDNSKWTISVTINPYQRFLGKNNGNYFNIDDNDVYKPSEYIIRICIAIGIICIEWVGPPRTPPPRRVVYLTWVFFKKFIIFRPLITMFGSPRTPPSRYFRPLLGGCRPDPSRAPPRGLKKKKPGSRLLHLIIMILIWIC